MKLYLVEADSPVDEYIVVGVFSTKELAEHIIDKHTPDRDWLHIVEIELNQETDSFKKYIKEIRG